MILHVFNPEHDLALACEDKNYTPVKSVKLFRKECGFMPIFFASAGDLIYVDDISIAKEKCAELALCFPFVVFVDALTIGLYKDKITKIIPWGWDRALVNLLERLGVVSDLLLDSSVLDTYRALSNRKFAIALFHELSLELSSPYIVGQAKYFEHIEDAVDYAQKYYCSVVKAPWSCSGRGLRFFYQDIEAVQLNWANNIIRSQGGIVVEPLYNKVLDFAMEFEVGMDAVGYHGLSIFNTINGSYVSSLIADESKKRAILAKYIPTHLIEKVRTILINILSCRLLGVYGGPVGIDMMIIEGEHSSDNVTSIKYFLHPMVEINLRRTMGHVSISMADKFFDSPKDMKINFDGAVYKLSFDDINDSY